MARPKNQKARRKELIAATTQLLLRGGQAGARLVDIAEAAGVTPAAVSYYYPDLSDLYADTYESAIEEYLTRRRKLVTAVPDPKARLLTCIHLGVPKPGTSSYDASVLLIELSALATRLERLVEAGKEFEAAQIEMFVEILEDGQKTGAFSLRRSPVETARAILATEDGIAIPVVAGRLDADAAFQATLAVTEGLVGTSLTQD